MISVELRYFGACPNWRLAQARLQQAMRAEGVPGNIALTQVETLQEAQRLGFLGSPSIIVNGVDLFGSGEIEPGLACRIYPTPTGPQGSPTVDQLRAALRRTESSRA